MAAMGRISQRAPVMYAPRLFSATSQKMQNLQTLPVAQFEPAALIDPNLLSEVCMTLF